MTKEKRVRPMGAKALKGSAEAKRQAAVIRASPNKPGWSDSIGIGPF
jgi:hypothetical protein